MKGDYGNEDEKESDNRGAKTTWYGIDVDGSERGGGRDKGASKMTTVHGNRVKSRNQDVVK